MRIRLIVAALALALGALPASAAKAPKAVRIPDAAMSQAAKLRDQALASDLAYRITESLTTEVGARMAGSEADARAVEWAKAKFKSLGYEKVWTEPVTFPKWERRSEHGAVLGAHSQPLSLTALGGSPGGAVEGDVVRFTDFASLEAAPAGSLAGKIAFLDFQMEPKRDGADYGMGSRIRTRGPTAAASKGAIGYLMHSAGTDSHRMPHTGITRFDDGVSPIPAAALASPDAQQLSRLVAMGPQRVRLALDCGWNGEATSYNVIGEVRGSSKPDEVVLIGGHLDSWDLGTGAIDDGAGVGISMAAGALIAKMPKHPARTIRVVAFANEEQGLHGGRAYAAAHLPQITKHQIGAESDFGADRIYGYASSLPENAHEADEQILSALAPLGITRLEAGKGEGPGSDVGPFAQQGLAWASLAQDGTHYFDLHHTPDDTFDKIDPGAIQQNAAAYAVFAYLAASADGSFGSSAKPADASASH
ncbi:M28 family peptidase [Cognatilysobacter lacus]|uniref:Carboxypeptidase Q n=1 Tax=Cognatilysobacter lacus TaxID=1643323 RepID=A0A5D8Z4E6_9GAMM|nr:M28 family peptidase [Lysobacter lacus]TZF87544.1 M28 family peptidase [Lysobacter lacus]